MEGSTGPAFIGRSSELKALEQALDDVHTGRARCILIDGEAGVGKTRLVEEFHARAGRRDCLTLMGHCIPTRGTIPFAPIVEVLRRLLRELGPGIDSVAGSARSELARIVPGFGDDEAEAPDLDEGSTQGRLFELILGFFGRLAAERCVVMTIEDLHWSDRSTQDLVSFLVRELTDERILLLGTFRPEDVRPGHPFGAMVAGMVQAKRVARIELQRFSRDEVAQKLAATIGEEPSPSLLDTIMSRSEGNPFFIEELIAGRPASPDLPRTVKDAFMARIQGLSEIARGVLRVAAVAGREIDHELLSRTAVIGEPELSDALRETVEHHLLVVRDDGYAFRHALLQEAVYQDLLPGERTLLHQAFARAISARLERTSTADPAALSELACHWDDAREWEPALFTSYEAGRAALAAFAFAEAHERFERVLELWDRVPRAAEKLGVARLDVVQQTAEAANLVGRHERAVELIRSALEVAGDADDPMLIGPLYDRLGHFLWQAGERQEAFTVSERAAEIARRMPRSAAYARSLTALARSRLLIGRNGEARDMADEALGVALEAGAAKEESVSRQVLGLALLLLGDPDAGERHLRDACRIALELTNVHEISASHVTLGVLLTALGRLDDAAEMLKGAREVARTLGFERTYGLWLKANQAYVDFPRGRWDDAVVFASDVVDDRHTPTRVALQLAHLALGQIATGRGSFDQARAHLEAAGSTGARQWTDPVPGASAELQIWSGEHERAAATVDEGLLRISPGTEERGDAAVLCWLGVRVAADRAQSARTLRDTGAGAAARGAAASLMDRLREIVARARGPGHILLPEVDALAATAEAEATRLEGAGDPDVWRAAARAWEALGQPFPRAYALWRAAEADLAGLGDRKRAAEALVSAYEIVQALGARPLGAEIASLARRARIGLGGAEGHPEPEAAAPGPVERIGLTPRELDVLELLVQGRTNTEIAKALFISDKTASVHVSHILAKLGVTNRVEAAGVAYRLGLVETASD